MRKTGFTLIELVMVIVIIGILAAVAIPRFMSLRVEAEKARCEADIGALRTGISGWYAKYHVNGTTCPAVEYGGTNASCSANGFPVAAQLNSDSFFAQFAFSDSRLPPASHIINNVTCPTWGDANCYDPVNGTLDQAAACIE